MVKLALRKHIAVHFNALDYKEDIIQSGSMKSYILISHTFWYKNCDLIDTSFLTHIMDRQATKDKFFKKFEFMNEIIGTILASGISEIDIYISEDGSVNSVDEFITKKTTSEFFLQKLLDSIYEFSDDYAYGFPTIKFQVTKD